VVEPVRAEKLGAITSPHGTLAREPPFAVLRCPSPSFAVLRSSHFCGPVTPCRSFVARAAAANVNPSTRLSHMTPFSGRDWCTRERCRQMMQKSQIFPEFSADDSQNFAASSGFSQNFPRIFRQSQTTPTPTVTCHEVGVVSINHDVICHKEA
jgi:hypothetical protein